MWTLGGNVNLMGKMWTLGGIYIYIYMFKCMYPNIICWVWLTLVTHQVQHIHMAVSIESILWMESKKFYLYIYIYYKVLQRWNLPFLILCLKMTLHTQMPYTPYFPRGSIYNPFPPRGSPLISKIIWHYTEYNNIGVGFRWSGMEKD